MKLAEEMNENKQKREEQELLVLDSILDVGEELEQKRVSHKIQQLQKDGWLI